MIGPIKFWIAVAFFLLSSIFLLHYPPSLIFEPTSLPGSALSHQPI